MDKIVKGMKIWWKFRQPAHDPVNNQKKQQKQFTQNYEISFDFRRKCISPLNKQHTFGH